MNASKIEKLLPLTISEDLCLVNMEPNGAIPGVVGRPDLSPLMDPFFGQS